MRVIHFYLIKTKINTLLLYVWIYVLLKMLVNLLINVFMNCQIVHILILHFEYYSVSWLIFCFLCWLISCATFCSIFFLYFYFLLLWILHIFHFIHTHMYIIFKTTNPESVYFLNGEFGPRKPFPEYNFPHCLKYNPLPTLPRPFPD